MMSLPVLTVSFTTTAEVKSNVSSINEAFENSTVSGTLQAYYFANDLNVAVAYEIGSQDAEESELRIKTNYTF